jgi:hypothetical protein
MDISSKEPNKITVKMLNGSKFYDISRNVYKYNCERHRDGIRVWKKPRGIEFFLISNAK